MKAIYTWVMAGSLIFSACNESRRGNDSNLNETRNEAAAEENSDKFEGKTERDAEFVYEAISANYAEIKMSELANQKSRSPEVQQIAQKLLVDHSASLNELKTLAQAKAIGVPVEESSGSMRKLENLAEESEKDFDQKWCNEMIDLHEKDISRFEDRLEDTEDAELKGFISKTLPTLKEHHQRLKAYIEREKNKNT